MKSVKLVKLTSKELQRINGGEEGGGTSPGCGTCPTCDCGSEGSIHDQTQSTRSSNGLAVKSYTS